MMNDLRYAARALAKHPILLVTTTLSIGIGVGVNVAVHSILRTVLLQSGPPATAPETLFTLQPGLSYPNYVDFIATDAFADLAARQSSTLTYRTGETTTTINAQICSLNFFEVLDLAPLYGRTFGSGRNPSTVNDSNVVVISYAFWQRLGGDGAVIDRTLYLNGWPYTIAGVLSKGTYSMVGPLVAPEVYVPIGPRVNVALESRRAAQFDIVGRLRGEMTPAQAVAALSAIAENLERQFPDANRNLRQRLSIVPRRGVIGRLSSPEGRVALVLLGVVYATVGMILIVVCANVAGLLLARSADRARETAIRVALGATRLRIMRQCLAESFIVATLGCVAGAALWVVVTTVVPRTALVANAGFELIPTPISLLQCLILAGVVTVACGMAPALSASQVTPAFGRRQTGLSLKRWSLRQTLVAGQVAVAFVLLVGGCVLMFTIVRQSLADPGFDMAHSLSVQMRLPTTSRPPDFFALRERLAGIPGVEAVSAGSLPIGLFGFERVRKADAAADQTMSVDVNRVGPRYLETIGIRLLRGRDLEDADIRQKPAPTPVVVGETFARRYFGGLDVLGQELVLDADPENGRAASRLRIVGVSHDGTLQVFGGDAVPIIHLPAVQPSLVVRTAAPIEASGAVVRALQRTLAQLEPGAAITVRPTSLQLATVLLPVRVATIFLSVLGALGLIVAMAGLYGTLSYTAARRRFEMGVRVALGASRTAVVGLILRDAIGVVAVGAVAGSLLSLAVTRAIWAILAGIQDSMTPLAILAVFVLTFIVGTMAALRPALASANVHPMHALRED